MTTSPTRAGPAGGPDRRGASPAPAPPQQHQIQHEPPPLDRRRTESPPTARLSTPAQGRGPGSVRFAAAGGGPPAKRRSLGSFGAADAADAPSAAVASAASADETLAHAQAAAHAHHAQLAALRAFSAFVGPAAHGAQGLGLVSGATPTTTTTVTVSTTLATPGAVLVASSSFGASGPSLGPYEGADAHDTLVRLQSQMGFFATTPAALEVRDADPDAAPAPWTWGAHAAPVPMAMAMSAPAHERGHERGHEHGHDHDHDHDAETKSQSHGISPSNASFGPFAQILAARARSSGGDGGGAPAAPPPPPVLPAGVLELTLHSAANMARAKAALAPLGLDAPLECLLRVAAWERTADPDARKAAARGIVDEFVAPDPDTPVSRLLAPATRLALVARVAKRGAQRDFFHAAKRELMRGVGEDPDIVRALTT